MFALLVIAIMAAMFSLGAPAFIWVAILAALLALRIFTRRFVAMVEMHDFRMAKAAQRADRDRIAYFL